MPRDGHEGGVGGGAGMGKKSRNDIGMLWNHLSKRINITALWCTVAGNKRPIGSKARLLSVSWKKYLPNINHHVHIWSCTFRAADSVSLLAAIYPRLHASPILLLIPNSRQPLSISKSASVRLASLWHVKTCCGISLKQIVDLLFWAEEVSVVPQKRMMECRTLWEHTHHRVFFHFRPGFIPTTATKRICDVSIDKCHRWFGKNLVGEFLFFSSRQERNHTEEIARSRRRRIYSWLENTKYFR